MSTGGAGGAGAPRADGGPGLPQRAILRLVLVAIGIVTGVTLVYVSAGTDVEMFGQTVSLAVPLIVVYVAGMLVGRFGNGPRS